MLSAARLRRAAASSPSSASTPARRTVGASRWTAPSTAPLPAPMSKKTSSVRSCSALSTHASEPAVMRPMMPPRPGSAVGSGTTELAKTRRHAAPSPHSARSHSAARSPVAAPPASSSSAAAAAAAAVTAAIADSRSARTCASAARHPTHVLSRATARLSLCGCRQSRWRWCSSSVPSLKMASQLRQRHSSSPNHSRSSRERCPLRGCGTNCRRGGARQLAIPPFHLV